MAKEPCPKDLDEILCLTGLNLKNSLLMKDTRNPYSKDTPLVIHECEDMAATEEKLRRHIPTCLNCSIIYTHFLNNERKFAESTIDADKRYLGVSNLGFSKM